MDLVLWRHADAEIGGPDLGRKLTKKGIKQSADIASWLKHRLLKPWKVISSPAERAIQTAKALSSEIEIDHEISPGADHLKILSAVSWPNSIGTVVVVGHQPTLGDVVGHLLRSSYQQLPFPKGSIFWFSYRDNLQPNQLVLRSVIGPDLL